MARPFCKGTCCKKGIQTQMQRSMQHPSHSTALRTATTVASSQGETSSYTDVDADGNSCTLNCKVLVLWRALFAALLQAETCVFGCCGVLWLQPCCRQRRVYSNAVACFGCSLAAGRNVCIGCCGVLWLQPCCRQQRVYSNAVACFGCSLAAGLRAMERTSSSLCVTVMTWTNICLLDRRTNRQTHSCTLSHTHNAHCPSCYVQFRLYDLNL